MTGSETIRNAGRELAKEIPAAVDGLTKLEKRCEEIGELRERIAVVEHLTRRAETHRDMPASVLLMAICVELEHGIHRIPPMTVERTPDRQEIRESIAEHNWEMATGR